MKTIDEDIKSGQFKKIYLLYGDEAYLKKQYKDKLKKALVQPDDTMNFTAYEGKDTNPKEVIDLSETLPFFADRRVILIENSGFFKGSCEELAEYMPQVPDTTLFLFVEEEVDNTDRGTSDTLDLDTSEKRGEEYHRFCHAAFFEQNRNGYGQY